MDMTQEQIKAEVQKLQAQLALATADAKIGILAKIKELQAKVQAATK